MRNSITVSSIEKAVDELNNGGVVVIPTDTVYGLACRVDDSEAIEQIYKIKSREKAKQLPILAADVESVERYGASISDEERKLMQKFWPGPLTIVLKVHGGTEAFRIPESEMALDVIRGAGGLLRVTSANVSGKPPAATAVEARLAVGGMVKVIVDSGEPLEGVPSTVMKVGDGRTEEQVIVFREGALSRQELEQAIDEE
ncbi:threonylcarbamoyl-AMP synthase [bacterium E08(2017)]|nr:threonylcarbamoyl-AMP synthase [bacterium E08(2017)]